MGKKVLLLLAIMMTLCQASPVFAETTPTDANITNATQTSPTIKFNGNEINLTAYARMVDEKVLVPLRMAAEVFRCGIEWKTHSNRDLAGILFSSESRLLCFVLDSPYVLDITDGNYIKMPIAITVVDDMAYVPLRFLTDQLGYKTEWSNVNETINITGKPITSIKKVENRTDDAAFNDALYNLGNLTRLTKEVNNTIWLSKRIFHTTDKGDYIINDKIDNTEESLSEIEKLTIESVGMNSFPLKDLNKKSENLSSQNSKVFFIQLIARKDDDSKVTFLLQPSTPFKSYEDGGCYFNSNPFETYAISEENQALIREAKIAMGMKPVEVHLSWGYPSYVNSLRYPNLNHEFWAYKDIYKTDRFVNFDNDLVTWYQ